MAKIFKPIHVFFITALFGPLAGGLMSGLDYKYAGSSKWVIVLFGPFIIWYISVLGVLALEPENQYLGLLTSLVFAFIYQIYQYQLQDLLKGSYQFRNIFSGIGIGVLSLFLSSISIIPLYLILDIDPSSL